jgi:hypothetical protein
MSDNCPICGAFIEVIVQWHSEVPFVDGRYYDLVCFTCASVPRVWAWGEDGEMVWYGTKSPDRLASVEDMMSDGWSKEEAQQSIKAIKKLLKNPRIIIESDLDFNVLECLFLGNSKLYELSV